MRAGALAAAGCGLESMIRWEALRSLRAILPKVRSEDREVVGIRGIQYLTRLMDRASRGLIASQAHVAEILSALERIGGEESIDPVERVARWGGSTSNRVAAARILPNLRARAQAERNPKLLLRPAEPELALLIPASAGSVDSESALMRPADGTG